jgi:hypothetical protein
MTEHKYGISLHGQAIEGGGNLHETLHELAGKMGSSPKVKAAMDNGYQIFRKSEDPIYKDQQKNK